MLRYFIASQFWLFITLSLVLGQGTARVNPTYYNIFGLGWLSPAFFWLVVIVCGLVSLGCSIKHHRTLKLPD